MKKYLKPKTFSAFFANLFLVVFGVVTFLGNGATLNGTNSSLESYSIPEPVKHEVATTYNIYLPGNQGGYSLVAKNGSNTTVTYGGLLLSFSLCLPRIRSPLLLLKSTGRRLRLPVERNIRFGISTNI